MIAVRPTQEDREKLAALQVDPALLVDDGQEYTGLMVKKPWGREMQLRCTADFAATRVEIAPHAETSMHCHPSKTVVLFVEHGILWLNTLAGSYRIKPGEGALVEKATFHQLLAEGAGAVVTEIEFPPNKRDLVRLRDRWGRGQGYEKCA